MELPATQGRLFFPEFDRYASELVDEWERRKNAEQSKRAYSANAWFKREVYKMALHYIASGKQHRFEHIVRQDGRANRLVTEAIRNPFKLILLAMFADASPISRQDRNVFGNQMLFAWAHDVPWDFLNAFLAVSGGPTAVAKKLKLKEAEPGFEHRFIPDRLADSG